MHNLQIMGAVYSSGIIERYKLTASTSLVLIALCYHYNTIRNDSFPSQETIASKTNLSKSSLVRAIKQLLQAGFILKVKNKYGNLYKFTQKFFDELNLTPGTNQNEISQVSKREIHDNKINKNNKLNKMTILNKKEAVFSNLNQSQCTNIQPERRALKSSSNHAQIEHMIKHQYWRHIPSGKTLKVLPDVGNHILIKYHSQSRLVQFFDCGLVDEIKNFEVA